MVEVLAALKHLVAKAFRQVKYFLDKLAEAYLLMLPDLLSWLLSSWMGQLGPFTFWKLCPSWMQMIQRKLHFHPSCPSANTEHLILRQPIFCCLMIILTCFCQETQSLMCYPSKKTVRLRLVISTYTAQACLWNPYWLHFATEDHLRLVYSWIQKFLRPWKQRDFWMETSPCSSHSCCFNSSGYFFNFYPGLRAV